MSQNDLVLSHSSAPWPISSETFDFTVISVCQGMFSSVKRKASKRILSFSSADKKTLLHNMAYGGHWPSEPLHGALKKLAESIRLPAAWCQRADAAVKEVMDVLEQHQHPDAQLIRWEVVGGYAKQTSTCLKADMDLGKRAGIIGLQGLVIIACRI